MPEVREFHNRKRQQPQTSGVPKTSKALLLRAAPGLLLLPSVNDNEPSCSGGWSGHSRMDFRAAMCCMCPLLETALTGIRLHCLERASQLLGV